MAPQIDPKTGERIGPALQIIDPATGERIPATAAPAATPQPGFLHELGDSLGLGGPEPPLKDRLKTELKNAALGPLSVVPSLYQGAKRTLGAAYDAGASLAAGNKAEAGLHALDAVPIVGPAMLKMADSSPATKPGESYLRQVWSDQTPGNIGTEIGTAAQVAPMVLGGIDAATTERPLLGRIPTKAHAGKIFSSLDTDLANQPVPLKQTLQPLQRATELGVRGGTLPKAASDLLTRSQALEPMSYPEARDYQSNLSDLSREAEGSMNRKMLGQIGKLNKGLYGDIYDAADQVGRGPDYARAMKEFRQAAQIKDTLKKSAIPLAVGGVSAVAGPSVVKYLKGLF